MSFRLKTSSSIAVVLVAALLSLGGCSQDAAVTEPTGDDSTAHLYAVYPEFDDLNDMVYEADAIIAVEFVSVRTDVIYPELGGGDDPATNPQAGVDPAEIDMTELGVPVTISTVKVTSSLKGELSAGELLEVSQVGGPMEGVQYVEDQTLLLGDIANADSLMLFVNIHDDGSADLVSASSGVLVVEEGDELREACTSDDHCGEQMATTVQEVRQAVEESENSE